MGYQTAGWINPTWTFRHADGLGSTRQKTDQRGYVTASYTYDAFGALRSGEPSSILGDFLFTGEQYDASTGLYYLRARYYDPATGRFTQQDPFPGVLSMPATLNPYVYVLNNPANLTDPSGQVPPLLIAAGVYVGGYFCG